MATGMFITFEGPDGAGKSTQVAILADRLRHLGIGCITTREPGGTKISDQIRHILLHTEYAGMAPETEALLYAASRAQHVHEVIRPALEKGLVVICDRYIDASIAYQASGLGLSSDMIRRWSIDATDGLWPDRTYLIDIPAEVGIERIAQARTGFDRIESRSLDYHNTVRETFLLLAQEEPARFTCISGIQTPQKIAEQVWADLESRLGKHELKT